MGVTVLVFIADERLFKALWENHAYPKTRQKGSDFFHDACDVAQNFNWLYCLSTYVPDIYAFEWQLFLLYAQK